MEEREDDLGSVSLQIERAVQAIVPSMDERDVHNVAVGIVSDVTGMLPWPVEEAYLTYQTSRPKAHLPSWWPKDSTEGGQQ